MRTMRASGGESSHATDEDLLPSLKPQWLKDQSQQHHHNHHSSASSSASGVKHPFHSTDMSRRGGRKFGDDRRLTRRVGALEGIASKPSTAGGAGSASDFPPLPPFYRSHSTGSLTPADSRSQPSASSRLLSTQEAKNFSINRECDFPTLATAAAVEQPTKMNKSKSATALPQAISPSLDLLKAYQTTTLAALVNPTPTSSPSLPSAALPSDAKKPSFSAMAASATGTSDKAAANKAKFQQSMASRQAELQKHKSLVPSKPVHPALSRTGARPIQAKPRIKKPLAPIVKAPPAEIPSPSAMRKATSAPVLTMAITRPRSPPIPSPLSIIASNSPFGISPAPLSTSPPRPVAMVSSRSARTLPQATMAKPVPTTNGVSEKKQSRSTFALPYASASSSHSPRRRESLPTPALSLSSSSPRNVTDGTSSEPHSLRSSDSGTSGANGNSMHRPLSSSATKAESKSRSLRGSGSSSSKGSSPSGPEPTPEELLKKLQQNTEAMWMAFENEDRHHRPEDDEEYLVVEDEEEQQSPEACSQSNASENEVEEDPMSMEATSFALAAELLRQQQQQAEKFAAPILQNEHCPFSWEVLADEEWSEFSEDRVLTFMKTELGYEGKPDELSECESADDGGSENFLTEEEIRSAKQQIEREQANLQELLEKRRKGLSESLKKWQPSASTAAAVASSADNAAATATTSSFASSVSTHKQRRQVGSSRSPPKGGRRELRLSSAASDVSALKKRTAAQVHIIRNEELDSDSDDSDGDEIHSFPSIVFG